MKDTESGYPHRNCWGMRRELDEATKNKYRYETDSERNKDERDKTEKDVKEMCQWSLQIVVNMERELCVTEGMSIDATSR